MRLFPLAAFTLGLALPASSDDLLEAVRSASTDGPLYAYEMTYVEGDIAASGTVYPTAPQGERIVVSSPEPEDWPDGFDEELAQMDAETDGDIWCNEFAEDVPDSAERTFEDGELVTYTFTPEPGENADNAERKMMENMDGTLIVDAADPAVISYQLHLPEAVKPNFFARIESFDLMVQCARAPDGRTYVQQFEIDVQGSAMGQAFNQTVSRSITRLLDPAEPA